MLKKTVGAVCILSPILLGGCGQSWNPPESLVLSAHSYDFGYNIVGNTLTSIVVIATNTGNHPLPISPALSGDSSFHLASENSCGPSLPAFGSCQEIVTYTPTSPSAPARQTATIAFGAANSPESNSTVTVTGIAAILTPGTVTPTSNPQVALYSITSPFPGDVVVKFGRGTTYPLSTSTQSTPGGVATNILIAGMLPNSSYQMQASITFANGLTVTDTSHALTTTSYPPGLLPHLTATTMGGQTPQPGIEMLNPCCVGATLQLLATDLSGNVVWAYQP